MNEPTRILSSFKGVIDSTLREGFQFSRANFTPGQQVKIFGYLDRIGVDYVEVGNPAQAEIREMIAALVRRRRPGGPRSSATSATTTATSAGPSTAAPTGSTSCAPPTPSGWRRWA